MAKAPPALADALELADRWAPKLRAGGVKVFEFGGLRLELAPDQPAADDDDDEAPQPTNPLQDPWTFGGPHRKVPTIFDEEDEAEGEDEHGRPLGGVDEGDE